VRCVETVTTRAIGKPDRGGTALADAQWNDMKN
jgi:hypothetical protein